MYTCVQEHQNNNKDPLAEVGTFHNSDKSRALGNESYGDFWLSTFRYDERILGVEFYRALADL